MRNRETGIRRRKSPLISTPIPVLTGVILLIPDGKGPFPTVNALHDHGAHLFIGKEKMIRPFFTPEEKDSPYEAGALSGDSG
mgnify:CR=1 FL=1